MSLRFLLASFVLAVVPGPGVVFLVARTLASGRAVGLASVFGVALGNLLNAVAATLGLAAVVALWPTAFTLVKYGGAAYLVILGLRSLRAAPSPDAPPTPRTSEAAALRQGFLVAASNPKTALFFAAFLPQFVDASGPRGLMDGILLGATFASIALVTDSAYVLGASTASSWLGGRGTRAARLMGACALVGLGLWTALSHAGPPPAHPA